MHQIIYNMLMQLNNCVPMSDPFDTSDIKLTGLFASDAFCITYRVISCRLHTNSMY